MILASLTMESIAQDYEANKQLSLFAAKTAGWIEGFARNTGVNEFSYHSFRGDITRCLLTRCSDGQMEIEWETGEVGSGRALGETGFVWMAAINHEKDKKLFDFYVNGKKEFEIESGKTGNWMLKNENGLVLEFLQVENDQHGDAHGYMALSLPANRAIAGKPVKLKIAGQAGNSQSWIIVFQAGDALRYLQESDKFNSWCEIEFAKEKGKYLANFTLPVKYAGKEIYIIVGSHRITLTPQEASGGISACRLSLTSKEIEGNPFMLEDESGTLLYRNKIDEAGQSIQITEQGILTSEFSKTSSGTTRIKATRDYDTKQANLFRELGRSAMKEGIVYLMNSSHQDIAWMDDPEKCIIQRDTMLLTPLLDKASKDPSYRFDIEDVLMIREYVERHPDKKDLLRQMLAEGRLSCGSSYIQPYEEMYSGESLVRQFYLGAKWLKREFYYTADTYWNEDVPGRTLQMPQILAKSGTKNLMLSRHEKGLFRWTSPDGSSVFAYSPGHYSEAFTPLNKGFRDASGYIARLALDFEKFYPNLTARPAIPLLSDWDMSPAKDYSPMISQWKNVRFVQDGNKKFIPLKLPEIEISLAPRFLEIASHRATYIPSISGERPAVWLYIHGPSHHQAIKVSREGDILITQAEKFAAFNSWIDGDFSAYPEKELQEAWESKIYPDHGWGGKNGDITDNTFLQKYLWAKSSAEKILGDALERISSKIKLNATRGRAIVVFNSLNWKRTDIAECSIRFGENEAANFTLTEASGNPVSVQVINPEKYSNGNLKSATFVFPAGNIPPLGYKTFYILPSPVSSSIERKTLSENYENKFYKIEFGHGGLKSIYDKELNRELIDPSKFTAGEIFTMRSVGNGAGEFSDIQQPDMEGFDRTGIYSPGWVISGDGPVYTSFRYRQKIKHAVVEEEIIIYKELKRIDFKISLLNWKGSLYREFRMALPVNMNGGEINYEVPFGKVTVGKDEIPGYAGERYTTVCKDIHPRGIENWIGVSDPSFGVTLSSSVAVADYIDPTGMTMDKIMLQPILLASRHSCHSEGNPYLQTGDHHFSFSFTSHRPGWENGLRFGRQSNEALVSVPVYKSYSDAGLPEELSFFMADIPGIIITSVKKAEEENAFIVRGYNYFNSEVRFEPRAFKPIREIVPVNLIEEIVPGADPGNKEMIFGKFSIETYLIR